LIENNQPQ